MKILRSGRLHKNRMSRYNPLKANRKTCADLFLIRKSENGSSGFPWKKGRNLENYTVQGLLDELRTYEHELKKKKEEQVTPFPTTLMTAPRVPSSEGTCPRNCDTPSSSQLSSSKMENYDEEFAMMVKQFRKFKKLFKKADSVKRPSKGKPQVSDSPPESYLCYNCRKPGYWKSACPYPKVGKYGERERIEKKKKAMVAAESDESSSSSSDEEALICMERRAEKSNHEDRWTMSDDDTLCLMPKDDADQEVTSQTSCSSSYESIPTSENLFDQFKKMMKDFEEINLKHSSLTKENKLLSEENLKLTEGRKSQLNEITQLKTENESLSEKVKSINKELGTLKSKEAVDKLLETTKHKGREGLGFDPSNSKRKGKTTFIPPKPTAKPNKQKGKEKEKPTEVPKKEATKYPGVWYLDSGCSRHMTGDVSLLSNLIPYDGPRVTFGGSNDFGLTKGLGNLVYKGLTIQAVSYVEGINYNLLSISQFCDKGYSLEFCKDMASLKNISTNEVILTGKRIRNIYEVIWSDVKEACLISKEDVQEDAESLPMKLFQRTPSSHQVTNFHFHSSFTPALPDEIPENWTNKVQGLIESALASQHASFRKEIEKMEVRHTQLIEKSEGKHSTDLKEISKSVQKTLEIISLLSEAVSNTMEIYASDSQLHLKEINKVKEQKASVTISLQKQMSLLQMDIRSALAVASANQVVTKDYLKVIIDNQKEAYKLFRLIGANSGNRKMERNPENSVQLLSSSGLDGTEAIGTVVDHISNDAQSEERRENLRRIKELCGNMKGVSEVAGSSKRNRN
ncbi:unnamed protein product [Cuscuta campestris]|uniref:Retrovirus-related Pol polyprotein from transposon TNT 1-94-like beta-barrel domain-containing protein n=1 Tax=Cuscuta campestris TaxID=132261 RepID=A0A484N9M4_9ASTE|nr:unnamed protein product [Cuscuta campestris]